MNLTDSNPEKANMLEHAPPTVEDRARQSLKTTKEESIRKRLEGEDKTIRALSRVNNTTTCLITPRSTFSGKVDVEWNEDKASRMEGRLTIDTESTTQHLVFQTNPYLHKALENAAKHGPVPIKIFYDNTSLLRGIEEAMERGLNTRETLLGHLFCSHNSLYRSIDELPPHINEGNTGQHNAYQTLRRHRVALVQGLPGSGKTRLMVSILKNCLTLKATWLAETNETCEMLVLRAKKAGLNPVLLLAKGRRTPRNPELNAITAEAIAQKYGIRIDEIIASASLLVMTNSLATTHQIVQIQRHSDLLLIDEAGMIPSYRFAGLRTLLTSHLLICGDDKQNPPYKEQKGEFAYLLQNHPRLKATLSKQYRMHPGISRLSNALAYGGEMRDGIHNMAPLPRALPCFLSGRLILVDTPSPHHQVGKSSVNQVHLNVTLALYRILRNVYDLRQVQALSLYEAHASELLVALLPCFSEAPTPLSITQAQGNEFPVVILNMVKAGPGFPTNPQVINVAVSRAQTQLFIIADSKGLLESPMWSDLRTIWLDADADYLRPNLEYGKKNVKAERIIDTALSHPYHYWNGTEDSEQISP